MILEFILCIVLIWLFIFSIAFPILYFRSNRRSKLYIDELRIQIGILEGRLSHTFHITPKIQKQDKLPYKGAKRGPKPKVKENAE